MLVNITIQPELYTIIIEFDVTPDTSQDEVKKVIHNSMVAIAESSHVGDVDFNGYLGGSPEDKVLWVAYAGSTLWEIDWTNLEPSEVYGPASILELHPPF